MHEITLPNEATGQQIRALLAHIGPGLSDLRKDGIKVRLMNPPQLVGHNCYRAGLLNGPTDAELIGIRQDEGTAR